MRYQAEQLGPNVERTKSMIARISEISGRTSNSTLKALPQTSVVMTSLSIGGSAIAMGANFNEHQCLSLKKMGVEVKRYSESSANTYDLFVVDKIKFNKEKSLVSLIVGRALENTQQLKLGKEGSFVQVLAEVKSQIDRKKSSEQDVGTNFISPTP